MCVRARKVAAALVVFSVVVSAITGSAMASTVAAIEALASGTKNCTLDNASGQYPVVTTILSQPGTVGSLSYTSWSFLVQDSTGSMDIYGTPANLNYTPTVGDGIQATGEYYPYHQIPELESPFSGVSAKSSGNAVPAPKVTTIPTINVATLPQNVAGYMLELDKVTISGISSFDGANLTGSIKDGSNNSMTLYYWPTSYSVAYANLGGTTVPTGPVNMTGFVSVYNSVAEFTPITISTASVPEPGSLVLLGTGLAAAAMMFLRRRTGK